MSKAYDEFEGKTFRECAEIIVGNRNDKEWTDMQIDELERQHARKLNEAVREAQFMFVCLRPVRYWKAEHCKLHSTSRRNGRKQKGVSYKKKLRYRQSHPECANCKNTSNLTTDHIIPLFAGGHDKPSNYQTLCDPCHQFKSKIENQLKPFMNKGESNERTSR